MRKFECNDSDPSQQPNHGRIKTLFIDKCVSRTHRSVSHYLALHNGLSCSSDQTLTARTTRTAIKIWIGLQLLQQCTPLPNESYIMPLAKLALFESANHCAAQYQKYVRNTLSCINMQSPMDSFYLTFHSVSLYYSPTPLCELCHSGCLLFDSICSHALSLISSVASVI